MTDLPVEERKAMALGFLSMPKLLKPGVYYMAGFKQGREYSKQREEKLRECARKLIEAHDAWSVNSYPSDGGPAIAARAWFDEAQRVEGAVENLRAALAENGDTDV